MRVGGSVWMDICIYIYPHVDEEQVFPNVIYGNYKQFFEVRHCRYSVYE